MSAPGVCFYHVSILYHPSYFSVYMWWPTQVVATIRSLFEWLCYNIPRVNCWFRGWAPDFDILWTADTSLFSFVGCQNFQRALLSSLNCARRQLKANFKLGPSVMCLCLTFCYFEHTQHTKDTTLYFSTGLMCRHINSSLLLGAIQGSVQLEWPTKRSIATWAAPVGTN